MQPVDLRLQHFNPPLPSPFNSPQKNLAEIIYRNIFHEAHDIYPKFFDFYPENLKLIILETAEYAGIQDVIIIT